MPLEPSAKERTLQRPGCLRFYAHLWSGDLLPSALVEALPAGFGSVEGMGV